MKFELLERATQFLVISLLIIVTFSVSSWNMLDPFNLPKLTALLPISLAIVGLLVGGLLWKETRERVCARGKLLIVPLFFMINLILVSLVDSRDLSTTLYGTWGRNTGLLAYLGLTFLLLASIVISSQKIVSKVLKCFLFSASILAVYGALQNFGIEFFNYQTQVTSPVFSTFGNPNFHSAFMGLGALAGTLCLFSGGKRDLTRLALVGLVLIFLFNVYVSSAQGFFVWILGVSFGVLLYLLMKKSFTLFWVMFCSSLLGFSLLILAFFNIGPFASYVFNPSVQVRGYYWFAGLKMMLDNPAFGVGLDGYGDWYLRSRSYSAFSYDPNLQSDTAHNLIVDIGASGGLPLLVCYLMIILIAVVSILKYVRNAQLVQWQYIVLCSIWFGYQMQSLISINQLGLGVWGWVFTGLVIGYPKSQPKPDTSNKKSKLPKSINNNLWAIKAPVISALVMFILGLVAVLPQYSASTTYYRALQIATVEGIEEGTYVKPYERYRFLYSAAILSQNGFHAESESILKFASNLYPNSFDLWRFYAENPKADQAQINTAKEQMRRLDPFNIKRE